MKILHVIGLLFSLIPNILSIDLAIAKSTAAPTQWKASKIAIENRDNGGFLLNITLKGAAKNEDSANKILEEVKLIFPLYSVTNSMSYDERGYSYNEMLYAINSLKFLSSGTISLSNRSVIISGQGLGGIDGLHSTEELFKQMPNTLRPGLATVNIDKNINPPLRLVRINENIYYRNPATHRYASTSPEVFTYEKISDIDKKKLLQSSAKFSNSGLADKETISTATALAIEQLGYSNLGEVIYDGRTYKISLSSETSERIKSIPPEKIELALSTLAKARLSDSPTTTSVKFGYTLVDRNQRTVDLIYVTNRKPENIDTGTNLSYGRNRSVYNTFGTVRVRIPENHRIGDVKIPFPGYNILNMYFMKEIPNKMEHFLVVGSEEKSRSDIIKEIRSNKNIPNSALIFIHGYNSSFDDAVIRLAQIVWDMQYNGVAMLFSWPSDDKLFSYEYDRNSALFSRSNLIELIKFLQDDVKIKDINIMAHSMGNFLALDAISSFSNNTNYKIQLNQMIMAAPDVDRDNYLLNIRSIHKISRGMTLYASSADKAIVASRTLARDYRAGDVIDGVPTVCEDVDSIDATAVGEDIFGLNHSIFSSTKSIINDMALVLRGVRPPNERLSEIVQIRPENSSTIFWRYQP